MIPWAFERVIGEVILHRTRLRSIFLTLDGEIVLTLALVRRWLSSENVDQRR